uniref:UvrD-like helicase C-terminal domain-containing protein n=1 Tax=Anas platyrhynchos platyrhynchos TaxID=8840 RepID=A0A493T1S0_ANAPP
FILVLDCYWIKINKQRLLTISSTYGSTFTVKYKALKKLCHIKHAWAKTIHTFQGSEEKTVVYVVGNPGRQHWQHVYTAVTRGRCRVYVIAEERHLRRAVNNKSIPRKTRLQRFLREEIAEISTCPEQISSTLTKDAPNPSESGTGPVKEESADLRKEQMGDSQQKISPYKRQRNHAENPGDQIVQESPLGSSRLQSLSLQHVTPRKLFKS